MPAFVQIPDLVCVAFDAVGTLIYPHPPVAEVYWRAGRGFGSRLSRGEIERRFAEVFARHSSLIPHPSTGLTQAGSNSPLTTHHYSSEREEREFWRRVVEETIFDAADPHACFEQLFAHFARGESWKCYPDVAAALKRVQAAGLRPVVATNFDTRLHAVCDALPELAPIELRIISSEVGRRKPAPEFYEALVRAAGCRAGQVLMVGDNRENDVGAARNCGLRAVLLNRSGAKTGDEISSLAELDRLVVVSGEW